MKKRFRIEEALTVNLKAFTECKLLTGIRKVCLRGNSIFVITGLRVGLAI